MASLIQVGAGQGRSESNIRTLKRYEAAFEIFHPVWGRSGVSGLRSLFLLAALVLVAPVQAQSGADEAKAVLMAKFIRFISWPEKSGPEASVQPFRLCLVGHSDMAGPLARQAGLMQTGGRPVEFVDITLAGEPGRCDMLFIADSQHDNLDQILAAVARQPVLTVGDTPGYAARGVMINFTGQGSRIRFEINSGAARAAGLRISSRLLKLAAAIISPQAMRTREKGAP